MPNSILKEETRPSRQANGRETQKSKDSLACRDAFSAACFVFVMLAVPAIASAIYQAVKF